MDRPRLRVTDRRILLLVKAFLKAGLLDELNEVRDTTTGTPGGFCPRCWPTSLCRSSMSTSGKGGRSWATAPMLA